MLKVHRLAMESTAIQILLLLIGLSNRFSPTVPLYSSRNVIQCRIVESLTGVWVTYFWAYFFFENNNGAKHGRKIVTNFDGLFHGGQRNSNIQTMGSDRR